MMANWFIRLAVLSALVLLPFPATAVARQLTYSGEVTYHERIALPPAASLRMALVDLDTPGSDPIVAAVASISSPGQVPLQFEFHVRAQAVDAEGRYGLIAEIVSHDRVWFRNPTPVLADAAAPVLVIVSLVPEPAVLSPQPDDSGDGALQVTTELFDTVWIIETIAGNPVSPSTRPTLSIAGDRRAGGSGGCNNYFTQARFDGPALYFGVVAATRMACAPDVMAQEAMLFAALEAVAGYTLDDARLTLLDASGKPIVALSRAE